MLNYQLRARVRAPYELKRSIKKSPKVSPTSRRGPRNALRLLVPWAIREAERQNPRVSVVVGLFRTGGLLGPWAHDGAAGGQCRWVGPAGLAASVGKGGGAWAPGGLHRSFTNSRNGSASLVAKLDTLPAS